MIDILSYCNPIYTSDNLTLSVDNIVIDSIISNPNARNHLMILLSNLSTANVIHWNSFHLGTYHEQFSIQMHDGTSFWLGIGLNSAKTLWNRCRIDFNPNKVAKHEAFHAIMIFLIANTTASNRTIKRFDLAIDIPVQRNNCFLIKDRRAYLERHHGQEFTQYLGAKSSTVGRVKLYNKQVEANLSRPLTRLELTLDPATPYENINFPTVYYLDDLQMVFDEAKATDTERFILNALLYGVGSLDNLGRKTRKKMEVLLELYVRNVKISQQDFNMIRSQLYSYLDGTYQIAV